MGAVDSVLGLGMPRKGPIIVSAEIRADKPTAYFGPRKLDDPPQATFHFGDGKWLMVFKYKKDAKAAQRAGGQQSASVPDDSKKQKEEVKDSKKQ